MRIQRIEKNDTKNFITTESTEELNKIHSPNEIQYGKWIIPGALGKAEWEDIAARIIHLSNEQGQFIASSIRAIFDQLKEEFELEEKFSEWQKEQFFEKQKDRSNLFKLIKNAVSNVLGNEIQAEQKEIEENIPQRAPVSVIRLQTMMGRPTAISYEIQAMIKEGLLEETLINKELYIAPTEKMVKKILQMQK